MIWGRMKTLLIVGGGRGNDVLYLANVPRVQREWLAVFAIAEQFIRFESYSHESRTHKIVAKRELL